jgi:hypothetical protein
LTAASMTVMPFWPSTSCRVPSFWMKVSLAIPVL